MLSGDKGGARLVVDVNGNVLVTCYDLMNIFNSTFQLIQTLHQNCR